MIHSYAISMHSEVTELELMNVVFPHPTRSELLQESVMSAFSRAIHFQTSFSTAAFLLSTSFYPNSAPEQN